MDNTVVLRNIIRGLVLIFVQVLVLRNLNLGVGWFSVITVFLYPVFFMHLPIQTPTWLMILIGAFYGYIIDVFYDTIGMHMAACIFSAYIRGGLLLFLEPQGGYKVGISPTRHNLGFLWFVRYAALFMFIHVFVFFSVEEFTPFYFKKIVLYTIPSFAISTLLVYLYNLLLDPKD